MALRIQLRHITFFLLKDFGLVADTASPALRRAIAFNSTQLHIGRLEALATWVGGKEMI